MTKSVQTVACDVAIIGAGPVGAATAILSAKAGFKTVLIDARDLTKTTRRDTRNFAIVRGSWRVLAAAGVTGALADHCTPLNGLEATDGGTHWFGAPSVLFTNDDLESGENDLPLGFMVEAEGLQAALTDAIAGEPMLTLMAPVRFEALQVAPGHMHVTLDDGTVLHTSVLVACDGGNSPVRTALGITTEGRDYGKSVFAADVNLSAPHNGIARQLFAPEGPFATLPLRGDRANLAWYMASGAAEALAKLPADKIEAELNARFADFAGTMTLDGPALAYPLSLAIATRIVGDRAVLMGDAARRVNPLAGQGLNLGFKDAAAFLEVICDARSVGLDIGAATVLQNYEQWRRFDATSTALGLDGVDRVFSNDNALLKPLRGLALKVANEVGPVRRALARQASAQQAGLPRLMRGDVPWG